MNINRHNYEEYFLLYIDNELDVTGKKAVETFIETNPDLADELDILKQACLQPAEDKVSFEPKKQLLEIAGANITSANYEEYFLRYIDNELSEDEKIAVETYVLQHPVLQDEFLQLKQTILPIEEIVFKEKQLLYRRSQPAMVINMRWTRIAAAAVILFIAGSIWWVRTDTTPGSQKNIAVVPSVVKPAPASPQKQNEVIPGKPVVIQKENFVTTSKRKMSDIASNSKSIKHDEQFTQPVLPEVNVSRTVSDKTISKGNNTDVAKTTIPDPTETAIRKMIDKPVVSEPSVASTTVNAEPLTQLDTDQPQDKNISIGGFQVNKEKVRGLFKRASRMFTSKLKTDENEEGKLQVAAFEINTKSK
ncbi:MAG: hypothetical protein JWN76_3627 [Chitinophagaceae bacterium]|nr:hypothetical protein [Chitinophagaceae bacterium]